MRPQDFQMIWESSRRVMSVGHRENPGLANPFMKGMKFGQHLLKYSYGSTVVANYMNDRGKVDGYNKSLNLV